MKHMNDYDIEFARSRFTRASKPNRLALVMVVDNLREWADNHSDGWAYWLKPRQAAQQAIALVESTTNAENDKQEREDITEAEMLAAVRPIKAFLTRQKVSAEDREIILRSVEPVEPVEAVEPEPQFTSGRTIVIDLDRVIKYADPEETLVEFATRVRSDLRSGGSVPWTRNNANVGPVRER